jgi:hypothetical protein
MRMGDLEITNLVFAKFGPKKQRIMKSFVRNFDSIENKRGRLSV